MRFRAQRVAEENTVLSGPDARVERQQKTVHVKRARQAPVVRGRGSP